MELIWVNVMLSINMPPLWGYSILPVRDRTQTGLRHGSSIEIKVVFFFKKPNCYCKLNHGEIHKHYCWGELPFTLNLYYSISLSFIIFHPEM